MLSLRAGRKAFFAQPVPFASLAIDDQFTFDARPPHIDAIYCKASADQARAVPLSGQYESFTYARIWVEPEQAVYPYTLNH